MLRSSGSVPCRAAVCVALLSLSALAGADDLERLRAYLGATQDMRAEFSQQVIGPEGDIVEQASGSVALSKPGRFRWNYREPYERIIVADGERVWFYEADLEQVTIRRLSAGIGDTPAALLTGDASALRNFDLRRTWSVDGIDWLQLAPISAEADFATVDIGFTGEELQRIEFVDRLGQRTRLVLTAIDRMPRLTADEFRFEIPPGVDVIGEDDM